MLRHLNGLIINIQILIVCNYNIYSNNNMYNNIVWIPGRHLPSLSRYLEVLGTASGKEPFGHVSILWQLCGCRSWNAFIWFINSWNRMAGPILLLWQVIIFYRIYYYEQYKIIVIKFRLVNI